MDQNDINKENVLSDTGDETTISPALKNNDTDNTELNTYDKVNPEKTKKVSLKESTEIQNPGETEKVNPEDADNQENEDPDNIDEFESKSIIDYSNHSKEELLDEIKTLLNSQEISEIKNEMDAIKVCFYKKHRAEVEKKKQHFIEEGGEPEDFKAPEDELEHEFKNLFKRYRNQRAEINRTQDQQKETNLLKKQEIIEEIKSLANTSESLNKTFEEFRELQKRWRETGVVLQAEARNLWSSYNHAVEQFYDFIKINQELRDLDLKKNLEAKMELCEKAEELLLDEKVIHAFNELQKLHDQFRELGPVPKDKREEIWERFKDATSKINKKHQDYFIAKKEEYRNNLEKKSTLCERAENLSTLVLKSIKEWKEKSAEIVVLQEEWRATGPAPRKENNKVFNRFKKACDTFFNHKREFFSQNFERMENNLQIKTDLCNQADAIKMSTNWEQSTKDLINLQKKWKETGPVPAKQSDALWKRFREACDYFFNKKKEYYANISTVYEENLKLKKELLATIENFQGSGNPQEDLTTIKAFQRNWTEIGFVPLKDKNELQQKYRNAINAHLDKLNLKSSQKEILKFKSKLTNFNTKPKGDHKIDKERDKLILKLKTLENDISILENNIGFFGKSKNAQVMINDYTKKIELAKEEMKIIEKKIRIIDGMEEQS